MQILYHATCEACGDHIRQATPCPLTGKIICQRCRRIDNFVGTPGWCRPEPSGSWHNAVRLYEDGPQRPRA